MPTRPPPSGSACPAARAPATRTAQRPPRCTWWISTPVPGPRCTSPPSPPTRYARAENAPSGMRWPPPTGGGSTPTNHPWRPGDSPSPPAGSGWSCGPTPPPARLGHPDPAQCSRTRPQPQGRTSSQVMVVDSSAGSRARPVPGSCLSRIADQGKQSSLRLGTGSGALGRGPVPRRARSLYNGVWHHERATGGMSASTTGDDYV